MEISDIDLNEAFENAIPTNVHGIYSRLFLNKNFFLASFQTFLSQTKNGNYVKQFFEDLKIFFLLKVQIGITGNEDIEIEFQNYGSYEEWEKVENYTFEEFYASRKK